MEEAKEPCGVLLECVWLWLCVRNFAGFLVSRGVFVRVCGRVMIGHTPTLLCFLPHFHTRRVWGSLTDPLTAISEWTFKLNRSLDDLPKGEQPHTHDEKCSRYRLLAIMQSNKLFFLFRHAKSVVFAYSFDFMYRVAHRELSCFSCLSSWFSWPNVMQLLSGSDVAEALPLVVFNWT